MDQNNISPEILQAKQRFGIIGNSPSLINAIERAIKVAPIDLSVLVTGESGSGKEFFPKIIHNYGSRKHNKYIAVNCGAIPEGTIDSELFGHEKGSFTGAISARKGYFEEANGGTIFLDEVAELPLTTQARLLRVLESGEFLKVGSSIVQKTDIRVVAATNVDMLKAVAEGKFREDLYYRLSTVQIQVPNLHDRGADVALLARKFASDFSEKYLTPIIRFSEDARRVMSLYRWPGNVRQLKNVIEQIALFNVGEEIDGHILSEYLPKNFGESVSLVAASRTPSYEVEREMLWKMILSMQTELHELREFVANDLKSKGDTIVSDSSHYGINNHRSLIKLPEESFTPYGVEPTTLEDTEKETISRSLERNRGNRRKAAQELNISERTLYRKIREYGLENN